MKQTRGQKMIIIGQKQRGRTEARGGKEANQSIAKEKHIRANEQRLKHEYSQTEQSQSIYNT